MPGTGPRGVDILLPLILIAVCGAGTIINPTLQAGKWGSFLKAGERREEEGRLPGLAINVGSVPFEFKINNEKYFSKYVSSYIRGCLNL